MSFCLGINQLGNGLGVGGETESWAGAFGDLRNPVEPSTSPWEHSILNENRQVKTTLKELSFKFYYFVKKSLFLKFFCSFPPFNISKIFKQHETYLAIKWRNSIQTKSKTPQKDAQKTLNKPTSLTWEFMYHQNWQLNPMQCGSLKDCGTHAMGQETTNDIFVN